MFLRRVAGLGRAGGRWLGRARRERRGFALGALVNTIVVVLVALVVPPLLEPSTELEDGDLVILSGKDQSDGQQRQELVRQWNATHPNKARIVELPTGADEQYSEMVARAQSPDFTADIYNLDVTWTAEFAEARYLTPLDESTVDTSGFLPQPLATCRYENTLWALPFNTDAGLLYHQDSVESAPATWDDLVEQSRGVLAAEHDPRLVAGYTTQLRDYEGLVINALEAIWDAGGEVVDENGDVVIDSPRAEAGLRRFAEGLAPESGLILPQARDEDETASTTSFGEHKVLFMRNWPLAYRDLERRNSDGSGPVPFKVANLPGPSVLGGQNLAISSKSSKPRAAQELIEFLTGPRSQQILFQRGGFAATRDIVYLDTAVQQNRPYATTLLKAIRQARLRPVSPHYVRFASAFRRVVREAIDNGGRLPPDATSVLTAALRGQ